MRAVPGFAIAAALVAPLRAQAEPEPDFTRATELYRSAEAAVAEGRFADAVAELGAAYDLTRDPVLFFKIASANERAGKCDLAVVYYRRYLDEAHPDDHFAQLTRERITACGGDRRAAEPPGPPVVEPPRPPEPPIAAVPTAKPAPVTVGHGTRTTWLLVGTSLGLVTIGAVLAYATSSSENDLKDLYLGVENRPPTFDATTQKRYQELLDVGHRYEVLSWTAFGLAGAAAIGAAILFGTQAPEAPHVAPIVTVTPRGAGVSLGGRF